MFYALFAYGHYFFNTDLSKSVFSTYYFGKLFFCLSVFYVFCDISFEFMKSTFSLMKLSEVAN